MTETIRIEVWRNAEDGAPVRYREGTVDITDNHIRAIVERARSMGLLPSVVKDSLTAQPAAPVDDEATVKAIWEYFNTYNTFVQSVCIT